MQPTTGPPRDTFTDDDVIGVIRDAPSLLISSGVELLNQNLDVLDDLADNLVGGDVARDSYADLHGSANLQIDVELDWGTAILRPYMVMSDGVTELRFNLGAYYTSTPEHAIGANLNVNTVTGIDILDGLNSSVGETYVVDTGVPYLTAVEGILLANGYTQYLLEQTAIGSILPSPKVWILDDNTTWLKIVNDLLAAIGYQSIFSDWNGQLVAQAYNDPALRASEFSYDVGETTTMIEPNRSIELDFYKVPNRWVFYRTGSTDGPAPVEGNGIYTFVNQSTGPTSVDSRGGRVITRTQGIDSVDQSALVSTGTVTINADQQVANKLKLTTSPNPLHWHFDRVTLDDPAVGLTQDVIVAQWTLPLNGAAMAHAWTLI